MDAVRIHATWSGPDSDVLTLIPRSSRTLWEADPLDDNPLVALYREIDAAERYTGRVVGLEIVGFLCFDAWHLLPRRPLWWQLDDDEPRHLSDLLRELQARLRLEAHVKA